MNALQREKYKIDHILKKTKNPTKKNSGIQKSDSEYCASFEMPKNHLKIVNKISNNSENKIGKNVKHDFSFDSAHSA